VRTAAGSSSEIEKRGGAAYRLARVWFGVVTTECATEVRHFEDVVAKSAVDVGLAY
jgi:hypothetical protein